MDISPEKQDNSDKKETNPEELINTNKINEEKDKEQDKENLALLGGFLGHE